MGNTERIFLVSDFLSTSAVFMVKSRISENQLTGSEKVICGLLIGVKAHTV